MIAMSIAPDITQWIADRSLQFMAAEVVQQLQGKRSPKLRDADLRSAFRILEIYRLFPVMLIESGMNPGLIYSAMVEAFPGSTRHEAIAFVTGVLRQMICPSPDGVLSDQSLHLVQEFFRVIAEAPIADAAID